MYAVIDQRGNRRLTDVALKLDDVLNVLAPLMPALGDTFYVLDGDKLVARIHPDGGIDLLPPGGIHFDAPTGPAPQSRVALKASGEEGTVAWRSPDFRSLRVEWDDGTNCHVGADLVRSIPTPDEDDAVAAGVVRYYGRAR